MALIIKGRMPKEFAEELGNCDGCQLDCPLRVKRPDVYRTNKDGTKSVLHEVWSCGHQEGPFDGFSEYSCPIIGEIPDKHGRLIDADDLIKEIREALEVKKTGNDVIDNAMAQIFEQFIRIITNTPTVVEATDGN